ncbi:putative uncharacterized protein [Odoribacter sp. CAG:788]|mgnify:CR=1 FL=1|jgi:hypothetical protein|nr:putative uncharacterized protein [Odoribacter sp. CAG:788]
MKRRTYIALVIASFIAGALFRKCRPDATPFEPVRRDTIVTLDTVYPPVPEPQTDTVLKYDTVILHIKPVDDITSIVDTSGYTGDTMSQIKPISGVILPITRRTYKTEDYMAVVEGYKARLVSIELYRKNVTVTNTVVNTRPPRWALTLGPGVGYGPHGIQPYIGATFGFVLWSK